MQNLNSTGERLKTQPPDEIRTAVRENYGKVALSSNTGSCCRPDSSDNSTCCGSSGEAEDSLEKISRSLGYSSDETAQAPGQSNLGLGCGNPQTIASLKTGETVLDLGSGAGFDSFLAASAVGKTGRVIGVDMTPEMLNKARANLKESKFSNIDFRLGEIEHLPVANESVDVIISNCVINLSPEKKNVFQEAFRVLKSGGRLAISDIVTTAELPEEVRQDMTFYTGCVSGASSIQDMEIVLREAGFDSIRIKPRNESRNFIKKWVPGSNAGDYVISATIEAVKP
ncbi:MAG: arsenite methyltransferase [SAR324 cluster bacterium]|nr:arsenite methyltransferase [SAR324 cluster bacterium]